jgi:hypothetical protein
MFTHRPDGNPDQTSPASAVSKLLSFLASADHSQSDARSSTPPSDRRSTGSDSPPAMVVQTPPAAFPATPPPPDLTRHVWLVREMWVALMPHAKGIILAIAVLLGVWLARR